MPPLLVLLGALVFTLVGTPAARHLAWRTGLTAAPSPLRFHSRPTPLLGGLAIYGAVMLALGLMGSRDAQSQLAGILGGGTLVALVGVLDDRRPLGPTVKLLAEALAGTVLIVTGVHVALLGGPRLALPGAAEVGLWDALLTLLWVTAVTNAANLLDNMDGVLGGVAAVAAGGFVLLAVGSGQQLVAPLAAALAGASIGFLVYNFNPASIFMGDGGLLFLGFVLAALGIKLRFPGMPVAISWMLPVLVLALPLFDTCLVMVSRLRRGVNPLTTGGKDHLSHRLVARGASPREAALTIWLLAVGSGALALYVRHATLAEAWLALSILAAAALWGLWSLELRPGAIRMLPAGSRSAGRPPRRRGAAVNPSLDTPQPQADANATADALSRRIADREAKVGVVGLGYVGLPLAVALAEAGFRVRGVDLDPVKIAAIDAGRSPIADVESERVAPLVEAARLGAAADYGSLADCDAIFVCVPTPFDANKTPDLQFVRAAADGVAAQLRPGQLIVLQSTTYPGTTEEVILPRLEASDLEVGRDFFLAFSPERIDPGVPEHTVRNTPKVVGGVTPRCAELAADLLASLGPEVRIVSGPRVAEMTKLLENIFRSVNIALVNELAILGERMNLDIWEVIDAAATKPFGFMPFWPGAGVGGHCIPIDPYYLAWKAREYDFSTRFIELAADINQAMPFHAANLVARALDADGRATLGARVLVLGVAFKPNVDDPRNSPAERVIELLLARGAELEYHDPHIPRYRVGGSPILAEPVELIGQALDDARLERADVVVILTAHAAVDYDRVLRLAGRVVDTTRATQGRDDRHLIRLGAAWPAPAR